MEMTLELPQPEPQCLACGNSLPPYHAEADDLTDPTNGYGYCTSCYTIFDEYQRLSLCYQRRAALAAEEAVRLLAVMVAEGGVGSDG